MSADTDDTDTEDVPGDGDDDEMDRGCAAATFAAWEVMAEECGTGDQLINELRTLMGVPKSVISDGDSLTSGCHSILREGKDDADTPTDANAWVLCRAWEQLNSGDQDSLREALEAAWDEYD